MSDRDFEFGSLKFKLSKVDVFKQFHVARRMGPILGEIVPVMAQIHKASEKTGITESEKFEEIAKMAKPIMDGLAKLSDEDANYCLFGLLSAVEIQQASGNWARVANDSHLLFQDLELPVLLAAAAAAFKYNLSNFFAVLPRK